MIGPKLLGLLGLPNLKITSESGKKDSVFNSGNGEYETQTGFILEMTLMDSKFQVLTIKLKEPINLKSPHVHGENTVQNVIYYWVM